MYPANCRFVGVGLNAADAQVYDKKPVISCQNNILFSCVIAENMVDSGMFSGWAF